MSGREIIDSAAIRADAEAMLAASASAADGDADAECVQDVPRRWPELSSKALYGLTGEILRLIEPHTEADNAALLLQLLAGFGSLVGKSAYFRIGGDYHYTKLFVVLVGATARGRKGTSWSEVERLLVRVDEPFREAVQNGLSTGEGLIYHVRDRVSVARPIRNMDGSVQHSDDDLVDEGSKEKRALIIEPEFARVLKVIKREGNTLSSVIRQSWDTDRLSVMTKNPIKATEAHISIVGHITETELLRHLNETETANGFANRFLWGTVRRSKYLPEGGNLRDGDLNGVVTHLHEAALFARATHELRRDSAASDLWHRVYRPLSDGHGGLLGSITSRATAQVMRVACIYALLDRASTIHLEHLEAALGVWQYCEDSAKYIFGVSVGDKLADDIRAALARSPQGLSRTEISNHFGRHKTAQEIESALKVLLDLERIYLLREETGGRPREIYSANDAKEAK